MNNARVMKVCVWQAEDETWGLTVGNFFYQNRVAALASEWFATTGWASPEEVNAYFYGLHPEHQTLSTAEYPYVAPDLEIVVDASEDSEVILSKLDTHISDVNNRLFLSKSDEKMKAFPAGYIIDAEHHTVDLRSPKGIAFQRLRDKSTLVGWNAPDQDTPMDVSLWASLPDALVYSMMEDSHPGGQRLWSLISEAFLRPASNYAKKEDFWELGLIKSEGSPKDMQLTISGQDGKTSHLYRLFLKQAELSKKYSSIAAKDDIHSYIEQWMWICVTPNMVPLGLISEERQAEVRAELMACVEYFHPLLAKDVERAIEESDEKALEILKRFQELEVK